MLVWLTATCVPVLIQQNINGSDFFNRSWAEFKVGFNDTDGNYWLGNDLLSQLTLSRRYKLRFDLQLRNLSWYYAEYSEFLVYEESRNYELLVSGYSGNVPDTLTVHSGLVYCSPRMTVTTTRGPALTTTITVRCGVPRRRILVQELRLLQRQRCWRTLLLVLATDWISLSAVITHVADVLDHFAGCADNFDAKNPDYN